MNKFKKALNTVWDYKYVILAYAVILVLTIPLFSLCKSAVPSADDFVYGMPARKAFVETGSVLSAVQAAGKRTFESYLTWQGTYSSIFIMSLHPAVFSLKLYRFAAFMLIVITFICPMFLAYCLNRHIFKNNNKITYILAACYSFLTLQFWTSALEGIYWFNGAWYYTFSFEMLIVMIAVTIIFEKTQSKKARIASYVLMLAFSVFLGGTNYPQLLLMTVGYSFFILLIFIRRNPKKWMYAINWVVLGVFIAVNAFAPGNMTNYAKHINLKYTALCMVENFTAEFSSNPAVSLTLAVMLLSLPLIFKMVKSAQIKFIKPYLLVLASFFMLFSMYTPSAFIFHNAGPPRQENVRMMVMLLLVYINAINISGYYISKYEEKKFSLNPVIAGILLFVLLGSAFTGGKIMNAWSIRAQYSILGLEVSNFTVKMNEAFSKLEDGDIKSVDLSGLPTNEMLMSDKNSFINYDVGGFYGKEKVIYKKD